MRIAFYEVVAIGFDAFTFQTLLECDGCWLAVVVGYYNRAYHESTVLELASQPQHILVVCDAQVSALFVFVDVYGTDYDDNLNAVADFLEHSQFAVGLEAWQHSAGMMVVKQFSTQFEV